MINKFHKQVVKLEMALDPLPFTDDNLSNIKAKFYSKAGIEGASTNSRSNRSKNKKMLSLTVIACISLCLVTSAAAMGAFDLSHLVKIVGKEAISIWQPIGKVSENNGIKLETLAALNDDEMGAVYFTMTDVSGNRIDDTLDIYDFSVSGFNVHNAQLIHYDGSSQTATMLMLLNGGKKINGKKMIVHISSFLSGAVTNHDYNPGIDLYSLLANRPNPGYKWLNPKKESVSGGGEGFQALQQSEVAVLQPDETGTAISLPGMDWQDISAIGFVDGKLHIQVHPDHQMGRFNHGFFYFMDSKGARQNIAMYSISHGSYQVDQTTYSGDYIDYVYDLKEPSQLKDLILMGEFTTYQHFVTGDWKTSFIMEARTESRKGFINDENKAKTAVEVSPLGLTIKRKGIQAKDLSKAIITLHYTNGTIVNSNSGYSYITLDGSNQVKLYYSEAIKVEGLDYITINGDRVNFE